MFGTLQDLTEDFLRYLRVQKGRSKPTIRNYQLYLERFLSWLASTKLRIRKPKDLTVELITRYREHLSKLNLPPRGALSPLTQNYHLIALRSFIRYLKEKRLTDITPKTIPLLKNWQRKITLLSESELERLRVAVKDPHNGAEVSLRDGALIELIASTGMTVSEVVRLTTKNFLEPNRLTIHDKHAHERIVTLPSSCTQQLLAYLAVRPENEGPLFIRFDRAKHNTPLHSLTPRSIQRSFERYRKMAGLQKKVTPHTLRHSYARALINAGESIEHIKELLGHQHKSTTEVYQHIDQTK